MPDQYNVRTPLEDQWVDSPEQVHEVIGRYMQTEGAALIRVTVVRLPPGVGRAQMGEPLSPAEFWEES